MTIPSDKKDSKSVEKLMKSYDKYVPNKLFNLLNKENITEVNLGDHKELKLTILFSDIRDFTALSESLKPIENFNFINSYLSQMDAIITEYNGIIDKFMGDGIMALFHSCADDALKCSIEMISQLKYFNKQRKEKKQQSIKIGVGLNSGLCMLGIVGGVHKIEATVIGDAVNLASRLESLTKKYGVHLLISENTLNNLSNISDYSVRFIDRVMVKGKNKPHSIYEVFNNDKTRELKIQTKPMFEEALANYHFKNINAAKQLLLECLKINPDDNPAKVYLDRCEKYIKTGLHEGTIEIGKQIKWSKEFSVGDEILDQQHLELFTNSIKLLDAIKNGYKTDEVNKIVEFLDKYIVVHFETEEQYLDEIDYPFLELQKEQHKNFIQSFEMLKQEIMNSEISKIFLMFRIQTLLIDWVVNHTIKEDRHYGRYIQNTLKR